jgi:O-methyltransferase
MITSLKTRWWRKQAGQAPHSPQASVVISPPAFNLKVRWWDDPEWLKKYDRYVLPDSFTGEHHHRILDRRFTLQSFANSVKRLQGSTAECGVFKGVSSALICATLKGTYDSAAHYGFDSFEGLPEPTANDAAWQQGQLAVPHAAAQQHLAEFDFCRLVVGWIPETFRGLEQQSFRLVHIDVDLEQPTRESLDFFYPRAISGALFFFDDYGFRSCPGARSAIDAFMVDKPETVVELTTGQAFFYKR